MRSAHRHPRGIHPRDLAMMAAPQVKTREWDDKGSLVGFVASRNGAAGNPDSKVAFRAERLPQSGKGCNAAQ
jgi:hypothetical protein